ncbi:MAG: zinc ribbon domain-containing protein [Roseiflexaceae bacterium]|nr:zinc ribbon domain-containing protein [Roseiflexaceae bacterium]
MIKCPTCAAENDPANRFCDQCGTKLDAAAPAATPVVAVATSASPSTCANCGAAALPGEAFCDECGAPLAAASVSTDTSVTAGVAIPSAPPAASAAPDSTGSVTCSVCGHSNLPGDRFCEQCGAALNAAAAEAPTMVAPLIEVAVPIEAEPAAAPAATNGTVLPVEDDQDELPAADQLFPPAEAAQAAPAPDLVVDAPGAVADDQAAPADVAAEIAPPAAEIAPVQPDADAQRQQLTEEIARQDLLIQQFEQMQTMFGAGTPPAVIQGLDDAKTARSQAEAALSALVPAAPAIDPAQLAALQEEITRQEQVLAQFEQMRAMFGANTPSAVTQGIADAASARDQAAAELSTLTGGVAPAPVATLASALAPTAEMPPATAAPAEAQVAPAPAPVAEAAPAPKGARLVVEANHAEIPLVANKAELIIGREDPISGIFPEVDLTPYGGEGGGVSRQHAKLLNNNGQWSLVDLNSTNYTRLDGTKLEPNTPTAISDGARIQLGRIVVVFQA